MSTSGKRPFWMHQAAEYVLGAVFVAQGVQSPTPAVPTVLGGIVMLNTACAKGPLAAFRLFGPKVHRALDIAVAILIAVLAVLPLFSVESGTRLVMGGFAIALGFIAWQSDYTLRPPKPRKPAVRPTPPPAPNIRPGESTERPTTVSSPMNGAGDAFGRWAGRTAASGVNAYRRRKRS